jgi:hypothetical protein
MFAPLLALILGAPPEPPCADPVRVTVVVVYASAKTAETDPKLATLADEVRKRDPKLTGFSVVTTLQKSIPPGDAHTFDLPEKQTLKVAVDRSKDKDDRIGLTITPPGLGEITYSCVCGKFFPIVTPHKTSGGEQLIVAVMGKPCVAGKKDK